MSLSISLSVSAESYYVAVTGSDSNAGTISAPVRTIQKAVSLARAGDTVLVSPGEYDEMVETIQGGTSDTTRITFAATPENDPLQRVTVRGFQLKHPFVSVRGFDITYRMRRAASAVLKPEGQSHLAIYPTASNCIVRNNTVRDGVVLITDDFVFDSTNNSISTQKGNFLERGFIAGMSIYLGSSSKNYYKNHGTLKTIKSISDDGKTLFVNESLVAETTNPWFGIIYYRFDSSGFIGIQASLGTGTNAASNCSIDHNTMRGLFGSNIVVHGNDHVIESNLFENMQSFDFIRFFGSRTKIRKNIVRNNPDIIYYSATELGQIPHPEGGNFFDHMIAFFYGHGNNEDRYDNLIEGNYFENTYNQMGFVQESPKAYGLTFRNNTFVGMPMHMSNSLSGSTYENNTFFKSPYESQNALALGPRNASSPPMIDLVINRNAFIDLGSKGGTSTDSSGWYGISEPAPRVLYQADYNFVTNAEVLGHSGKRFFEGKELHGINGGDPLLFNTEDPDGIDNLPLTEDDGLRPLPNSPLCPTSQNNFTTIGAYSCLSCKDGTPFAHFSVKEPQWWIDIPDTTWLANDPEKRTTPLRPYTQPDNVGFVGSTVRFDASKSISCITPSSIDQTGITNYEWELGDGSAKVSGAAVAHSFSTPGDFTISLTTTNSLGKSSSYKRTYRILRSLPHHVLWLPFNNSTTDLSQRGQVATWSGTPTYTNSGRWGGAAVFGASGGNGISIKHRDDLDGMANLTIAGWAKKNSSTASGNIIALFTVYALRVLDNGYVYGAIYPENSAPLISTSVQVPDLAGDTTSWHHYAMTFDGTALKIYVDGALIPQATKAATGRLNRARDRNVEIGTGRSVSDPAFNGSIDDVRMYDTALSATDIMKLVQSSTGPLFDVVTPSAPSNLSIRVP